MHDDIKQHLASKLEEDIQHFFEAEDKINQSDVVESNYVAEYHNLLNLSRREIVNQIQLSQMFMKRGIRYDPTTFQEEIEINIQEHSNNYEAIKLNVKYGHFRTTFSIINVDQQSPLRFFGDSIAGSFGQIYKYCINQTTIAIKSIKIEESKFEKTFRQIIQEYFFLAIASVLKVGPKEIPVFGFEIVIFSDSFNFAMEYCEIGSLRKNEVIDLKDKLYLLHLLQIVHLDIKPQNIGYSHAFDGYIFIDFGLSRMIKQIIGKKSMTGFVGSMNYCSPQMLDLFDMVGSKFVDLYYCDAYALNKSINSLKPEQLLEDSDLIYQMLNSKKINYQGLIPTEIMLKVKWALFQLSTNHNFQTQILSKYQNFVRKNISQLNHFLSVLPQTLQLIKYFNKFLKGDESMEEQSSFFPYENVRRKRIKNQQNTDLFQDRYIKIQRINEAIEKGSDIQIQVLFDEMQVRIYRFSVYKLALAQYIRINSWNKNFQRKLSACQIFNEIYMQIKELSSLSIYKKTVQFLFLSSLNTKEDENFHTLKNIIETVAILQIVPQQTFINSYVTVLSMDLPFVKKMRLVIEFITALQFIRYKYKKTYTYKKIKQIFFELLNRYLNENKEMFVDQCEQELFTKLKYIVSYKIEINEQNIYISSQILKAEYFLFSSQFKNLFSLLICYIYYDFILSKLQRNYSLGNNYVQWLLTMINQQNHYCERFGYLEFALFEFAWITNRINYFNTIYRIFQEEFCFFEEHRFIDIYLFHKLTNIKKYLTKKRFEKRKEALQSHSNEVDNEFQQIFELLDVAIKSNDNFHRYIGLLLFNSPQIYYSDLYLRYIDKLVSNNRQKILQLSNQFNHYMQKTHYLSLKFEISVISHIFSFMSSYSKLSPQFWIETLSNFMKKCDTAANKITCFECKVIGMLEISQIHINYLNYQNKRQESFFKSLEIVIFHLKYKQLIPDSFIVMVPLMKRWCRQRLAKKYNLQGFLYEFIKIIKHHYFCLVDIKEYNIFLNLYNYIFLRESKEELVDFLLKICKVLATMKSINYIDRFYNSILLLIEMNYNSDHLESFIVYHGSIIVSLLSLNLASYPYISLYFTALLKLKLNPELQTKLLKAISLAIKFIDKHSREIIFKNYFEYFPHFLSIPARKKKYALSQHLKYSSLKFNFHLVLKIKLEMKDKSTCIQRKVKKLKQYIRAFHKNLNNIV